MSGSLATTARMPTARAQEIAASFDLRALPADFYANPYPVYDLLRVTAAGAPDARRRWFLTRYADLVAVYRDARPSARTRRSSSRPNTPCPYRGRDNNTRATAPLFDHHTTSLVFNDPPLHTRVRKLIMGALTRRAIRDMEGGLTSLVDQLLDGIAARGWRRSDRGLRQRDPGRGHRQPARRAACRPRAAAWLVAGDPRRAGAGADDRSRRRWAIAACPSFWTT